MKYFYILLSVAFIGSPVTAERLSFPPVDQAADDTTLVAFRNELLEMIASRDIEAVVDLACPDIYLSHGGTGGPLELRANLTETSDSSSDGTVGQTDLYWDALQETLSQPGYFDDLGEFWMPHQWQITLPAALDPFTAYFVTGNRVSLRKEPSRDASILDSISHEVVIVADFQPAAEYQRVRLTDGTTGFMHSDFLWSMVGYRAALVKSDAGQWQLCTFVAGD